MVNFQLTRLEDRLQEHTEKTEQDFRELSQGIGELKVLVVQELSEKATKEEVHAIRTWVWKVLLVLASSGAIGIGSLKVFFG